MVLSCWSFKKRERDFCEKYLWTVKPKAFPGDGVEWDALENGCSESSSSVQHTQMQTHVVLVVEDGFNELHRTHTHTVMLFFIIREAWWNLSNQTNGPKPELAVSKQLSYCRLMNNCVRGKEPLDNHKGDRDLSKSGSMKQKIRVLIELRCSKCSKHNQVTTTSICSNFICACFCALSGWELITTETFWITVWDCCITLQRF